MYIALGSGKFENTDDIVGIFDLDITSQSHITRKFLNNAEKQGKIKNAVEDIPKSFVITEKGNVWLSQPSTATLIKRIEETNNGRKRI